MEVDQERGTKRSCREAILPERHCDRQAGPGALLVDASGETVSPQGEEAAEVVLQPSQQPDLPSGEGKEGLNDPGDGIGCPQSEAMDVQQAKEPTGSSSPPAQPSTVVQEANSEDADREESKSSFSALVKAACTNRSYPY